MEGAPEAPILPPPPQQIASEERTPIEQPTVLQQLQQRQPAAVVSGGSIRFVPPAPNPNAAYIAAREALTDNSTKAERDAVRDKGLAQHRELFPNLY